MVWGVRPTSDDHTFKVTWQFVMSVRFESDIFDALRSGEGFEDESLFETSFSPPRQSHADYVVLASSMDFEYGRPHVDGDSWDNNEPSGYVFSSRRVPR